MPLEGEPPHTPCKKRIEDSLTRQGYTSNQPQNLDSTLSGRSNHMVLTARIEDETVRVIIDCGANRNYTSIRLENKLAKKRRQKDHPYPLTMADSSPVE